MPRRGRLRGRIDTRRPGTRGRLPRPPAAPSSPRGPNCSSPPPATCRRRCSADVASAGSCIDGRSAGRPRADRPGDRADVGHVPGAAVLGGHGTVDGGPHRPRPARGAAGRGTAAAGRRSGRWPTRSGAPRSRPPRSTRSSASCCSPACAGSRSSTPSRTARRPPTRTWGSGSASPRPPSPQKWPSLREPARRRTVSARIPVLQGRGMTMSDQLARHARKTPDAVGAAVRGRRAHLRRARRAGHPAGPGARRARRRRRRPGRRAGAQRHGGAGGVPRRGPARRDRRPGQLPAGRRRGRLRARRQRRAGARRRRGAGRGRGEGPRAGAGASPTGARHRRTELRGGARRRPRTEPLDVVVDEDEPAFIMYTSGTTGRPKGAVLTHLNLLMHAFSQVDPPGSRPTTGSRCPARRCSTSPGSAAMLPPLLLGGTHVIIRSGGFDPVATLDLIERERITSSSWCRPCGAVVAVPGIADRDLSSCAASPGAPRRRRPRCCAR